ncbi:glycerate kinase [Citrobacter sp. NCU1]|uniref:glycerate kinase n=1 Tax=Citrobacter sp. NCU1 TaxID=2026683 RepID=UPI001391EAF3|nr:glycerate kinase [Citrobacter sp. NCU1]NDO79643.1 glycerate kinase [Citrobacter sp. NCU1]
MKIIISPDSFKECLPAWEVARALADGWKTVLPHSNVVCLPVADGGEGTLETLIHATKGTLFQKEVTGPLGKSVVASFGILGNSNTAVIEMAQASGLEKVPAMMRNPLLTTTRGTGELIKAALDYGVESVIVCLGGSATNDGGTGMMAALGVKFFDHDNTEISPTGYNLTNIRRIDTSNMDSRLQHTRVVAACDVTNPLTGPQGATHIFGPQKGATPEMVNTLESGMQNYVLRLQDQCQKDIASIPGAGAAGGTGAALMAFMNAELKPGIAIVLDAINFHQHLKYAALVITGEGKMDSQSLNGKAPIGVAQAAWQMGVPVIGVAGYVERQLDTLRENGFEACFSVLNRPCDLATALEEGELNLRQLGENLAGFYRAVLI